MEPILSIEDLCVTFDDPRCERAMAVDGVSLTLHANQTLAVVGESGCGKSVTGMSITRLNPEPPARYARGRIIYRGADGGGVDLLSLPIGRLREYRGGHVAMVFQEPMTSLNPVYTVGEQVAEAVLLHQRVDGREAWQRAEKALESVGITDARRRSRSYPHELSGGMRQRVMIAMALACNPRVLVADEPTTALDVTIQAQILELLRGIQRGRGLGIVLITHALGVVAENADVVCVMYAGRVVEYATVTELFARPMHPYTRGLLRCIPSVTERRARLTTIRELMEDPVRLERESQEAGLPVGLRPWWPGHAAPAGVTRGVSERDSVLAEVTPGHWVGLWRTESASSLGVRGPDLAFRRGVAVASSAGGET